MKEFDFINKYLRPLAIDSKASFALGEDVAMPYLVDKGNEIVVSKDLFVENVHFLASDNPKDIASRLILSNISDIASCGALPRYYMLGLPKRSDLMGGFYDEFCSELAKIQEEYKISLIGGDTVAAKNDLFFSVTIFGEAKSGNFLRRNAAKPEDLIFVTEDLGGSFLGLQDKLGNDKLSILDESELKYAKECHNRPKIPILFASALLCEGISSCAIDISDGLVADLNHICQESKVGANLYLDKIPVCKAGLRLINEGVFDKIDLINGGEDYRLLFTLNKDRKNDVFTLANRFKIGLNYIGDITSLKAPRVELLDDKGQNIKLNYLGYEH